MSFRNPFRKMFEYKPDWEILEYEQEIEDFYKVVEVPIKVKNNSERLMEELKDLDKKNSKLLDIIEDLHDFALENFNKGILVTMIYRTQKEQDYLYRNSERYAIRKFKSPHQFWHGVDLRSKTFSPEQIGRMVEYINEKYNRENHYRFTADYHTVGAGYHFHIQFARE